MQFFDVDANYASFLRNVEGKVPYFGYSSHEKFLCGIVLKVGGHDYYAPVSHNQKLYPTSFAIRNPSNTNVILGTIRFNYMFPVPSQYVFPKNYKMIQATDIKYYNLLVNELTYCQSHDAEIYAHAAKVYRWGTNPQSWHFQHCCDFKKLESIYLDYGK